MSRSLTTVNNQWMSLATPSEIFTRSLRPTAIVGRALAGVSGSLSESLGSEIVNPEFCPSHDQARATLAAWTRDPQPLARPLMIIGGYIDAAQILGFYDSLLRPTFRDTPIVPISLGVCRSFAEARRRTFALIDSAATDITGGVDVIGLSLGGIVAVDVACAISAARPERRLDIRRIFAVGSPFQGVELASFIPVTRYLREMRPGSRFINRIAEASRSLEIIPYAHLHDDVVGFEHTAPPGHWPLWLADNSWFWSHLASLFDIRIVADIAGRLRTAER